MLSRIAGLVGDALERRQWLQDNFHESDEARRAFEGGDIVFQRGAPTLAIILVRNSATVLVGNAVVAEGVHDLVAFRRAVERALKTAR